MGGLTNISGGGRNFSAMINETNMYRLANETSYYYVFVNTTYVYSDVGNISFDQISTIVYNVVSISAAVAVIAYRKLRAG